MWYYTVSVISRARISMQMHVFIWTGYTCQTLQIYVWWLNDSKYWYLFRACLHILAFWGVNSYIMHILKIFRFNSIYLDFYNSILCHFSGFNAYITLTCIILPFIDVFSYEWERERERETMRRSRNINFGLSLYLFSLSH